MQCLNPIRISNPSDNKPYLGTHIYVPCGKCPACIDRKRKEWIFRLKQESKYSMNNYFITLTYAPEHLPINDNGLPTFCKKDIQLFMKRLRFKLDKIQKQHGIPNDLHLRLRYFLVGEYGDERGRPHYHALFFNVVPDVDLWRIINECWAKGRVSVSPASNRRIGYIGNYMYGKSFLPDIEGADDTNIPPLMCSLKPGIGYSYLSDDIVSYHKKDIVLFVQDEQNHKSALPRYYKDKIFPPDVYGRTLWNKSQLQRLSQLIDEAQADEEYYRKYPNASMSPSTLKRERFLQLFHMRLHKHKNKHLKNNTY